MLEWTDYVPYQQVLVIMFLLGFLLFACLPLPLLSHQPIEISSSWPPLPFPEVFQRLRVKILAFSCYVHNEY